MKHTLVALMEDKSGVLNRVVSLFRRRNYNIDSLTVGHSETPGISRMTVVVNGDERAVDQVGKQLFKLINVTKVVNLKDQPMVARELALIKVKASQGTRSAIMELVDVFRAKIVDVSASTLTVEITGTEEKVDSLVGLLTPLGIEEMARTGRVAMTRGPGNNGNGTLGRETERQN